MKVSTLLWVSWLARLELRGFFYKEGEVLSKLSNGILKDVKVLENIYPKIEKGRLIKVNAIIIHQTNSSTAKQTFNSYEKGGHGAHFLIDKEGVIYQTANLNKKTYHVGKVRSRCYESKSCSKKELKNVSDILFEKGSKYSKRVSNLHKHEKDKAYPSRYPTNDDSIGIEIVGAFNKSLKTYESITDKQNKSLKWLVGEIYGHYAITKVDVFRHPKVSYKQLTEGSTAQW